MSERQHQDSRYSPYRYPERAAPVASGPRELVRALLEPGAPQRAAPGLVRALYVVLVFGIALTWVILVVVGFSQGAIPGILALLLGWIPAVLWVVCARVILEFYTAVDNLIERPVEALPRESASWEPAPREAVPSP